MPLSAIYLKFGDVNRRKDYPNFILIDGYYYETNNNALTASSSTGLSTPVSATLIRSTSSFNTLEALVISRANEDSRYVPRPAAIYAYYDI